jgi:hypothetical protein
MKIVITESKRKNVVTKWLDMDYGDLRKSSSSMSFRFIHYKNENNQTVFLFNRDTAEVTITEESLYQDLKHMFGLSIYELNDILIPWLKQTYNLHVERVTYSELY